jgi:hypothetical protein
MNTEHTTETWTAYQNPEDIRSNLWHIRVSEGLEDSLLGYCGECRARLISAAPELLEALKAIVAFDTPLPCGLLKQARAAIAKAKP